MEIRERIYNIQTTTLLRSARILTRALETWKDLLSLWLQWKPAVKTSVKTLKKWNNTNTIITTTNNNYLHVLFGVVSRRQESINSLIIIVISKTCDQENKQNDLRECQKLEEGRERAISIMMKK